MGSGGGDRRAGNCYTVSGLASRPSTIYTAKALFAYLDHAADAAAIFNDHQTNMTKQDAAAVVSAYDFRECARVVDVGGGHGALTAAILKACPRSEEHTSELQSLIT